MIRKRPRQRKLKPQDWLRVFELARVNGAVYEGENLPVRKWEWPKNGYLTRKRKEHSDEYSGTR
jgi:hypothetical protein